MGGQNNDSLKMFYGPQHLLRRTVLRGSCCKPGGVSQRKRSRGDGLEDDQSVICCYYFYCSFYSCHFLLIVKFVWLVVWLFGCLVGCLVVWLLGWLFHDVTHRSFPLSAAGGRRVWLVVRIPKEDKDQASVSKICRFPRVFLVLL